jgi:hypothetical protein
MITPEIADLLSGFVLLDQVITLHEDGAETVDGDLVLVEGLTEEEYDEVDEQGITPDEETDSDEEEEDGSSKETNWLEMWALCVSNGISNSEWERMTIPKVRALMKVKNKQQEFEVIL